MKTENNLKLLCIADLHHWLPDELHKLAELEYDVCFLLGDIRADALKEISRLVGEKPLFGVLGNHDEWETLSKCNIADIHAHTAVCGEYSFVGFGGSSRYKKSDYAMLYQKDSLKLSEDIDRNCVRCDVLISHDTAFKTFSKTDNAHIGLEGISNLIKRRKIRLNICGHHHENTVKKYGKCKIICVYRCSLVSLHKLPQNRIEAKVTSVF
jgi:Icc-related predicted phosphoesterase